MGMGISLLNGAKFFAHEDLILHAFHVRVSTSLTSFHNLLHSKQGLWCYFTFNSSCFFKEPQRVHVLPTRKTIRVRYPNKCYIGQNCIVCNCNNQSFGLIGYSIEEFETDNKKILNHANYIKLTGRTMSYSSLKLREANIRR